MPLPASRIALLYHFSDKTYGPHSQPAPFPYAIALDFKTASISHFRAARYSKDGHTSHIIIIEGRYMVMSHSKTPLTSSPPRAAQRGPLHQLGRAG